MSDDLKNKLLVNAGSILAANGFIMLVAPRRFSVLRTSAWTPQAFDRGLARLTGSDRLARVVGLLAAIAGLSMVTGGVMRTSPAR